MDETKLENMLSCFYAKVNKRITDYTIYCDQQIAKANKLADGNKDAIISALDAIIAMQETLIGVSD